MRKRLGITPIIAVIFLVMMTIAAAGAVFVWIKSIYNKFQVQEPLAVNIEVLYFKCHAGTKNLEIALANKGSAPIDIVPTRVFVWDAYSGAFLNGTSKIFSNKEDLPPGFQDFARVNGFTGNVNLTLGGYFQKDNVYRIRIDFPDMNRHSIIALEQSEVRFSCLAE